MIKKRCNKCSYIGPNKKKCNNEASCHIGCNLFCRMHGYASPGRCADVSFDDVITQLEKKVADLQILQNGTHNDANLAEIIQDTMENLEQVRILQMKTDTILQSRPFFITDVHPK
jgi:hypothetical protein